MEKNIEGTMAIVLLVLIQGVLASGAVEVQPSINPAVVGTSVTLSLSPSTTLKSGSWAVGESLILTWLGDQQAVFPSYSGRASVNILTGALYLSSITVADSGVYVVQSSDTQLKANASITVLEPISNVTLRANQTVLMEFNSSAVATCSVSSGSSLSFLWMNGSSEVTASDRVQLTDRNSTLTIVNVTRYDQGPFRCCVSNPVSNGTSNPVNFTISYGPDNMALTVNKQNTTSFLIGSNLTMLCSVQSNPPAQLRWAFRGERVNTTGPLLELFNVSESQSGAYSCLAFNNHTNMNSNITAYIMIAKPSLSGSEQQAVNVWLLPLLLVVASLFSLSGKLAKQGVARTLSRKTPINKKLRSNMESPVVFVLILAATNFAAAASIPQIYASVNPLPVGNNVTLFGQLPITTGAWMFNNQIIVMIFPGGQIITNTWSNRVTFNSTTSSLTIMSLQLEDSGVYTLQSVNNFLAQLTLSVQVPISNVTLRANATNLVEFNDTAVLMCSVLYGTSLSYVWLNGSSVVTTGGMVQLSNGGATLTIVSVTRYDQGVFRCNVSNGVSQEVSLPVLLNISYGPSNTTMTIMPMRSTYITGSNITLSCSADSIPPAIIQWMVDGMYINQSGPQLQLQMVKESNSGNYQCLFYNTVTLLFSSKSAMINILAPIVAVVVNHTGGPVILHERLILHCEVTGVVASFQWWRNGQRITADNTTEINNKTLIIFSVQLSDNGNYQCQAFNSVSNMTSSPYTVQVNYGPQMPTIMGPKMAKTGDNATFSCYASSNPTSSYKWFFNDSLVANTSEYVTPLLTKEMSGMYTCMAFNNITGKNSTANTMLTVLAPVTMASIKIVGDQPIQNHTFTLTCEASGDVDLIIWMYDWSQLYAGNTRNFSMDHATLTFDPVMNSDNGNYQCIASNALSSSSSQSFMLKVFYGPQMPTIMGPKMAKTGDNATFSCYASSNPTSSYKWFFNDSLVANTSEYVTPLLTKEMSGMYTCMAFNNITGKNSTANTMLTVLAPVTMASIKIVGDQPIQNHTFTLTCEASGDVDLIIWMYDWSQLYAGNTRNFSMDHATLTFDPVMNSDNGNYQCIASNALSSSSSQSFMLKVFYGPQMPTIMGPKMAKTGDNATFSCYASSNPTSSYKWFFNDSLVANTSEYVTPLLTKEMSGMYTCMAFNNITGKNSTAYMMLTVFDHLKYVHIETPMTPAIAGNSYNLMCNVSGPAGDVYWMKNGEPLHEDNRTVFSMDKKTVTFNPLGQNDTGLYQCMVINAGWNMTSAPYMLIVNFGPQTPMIEGPAFAETGHIAVFQCSAMSVPPSQFSWWFNGSEVSNTSMFKTDLLSLNMSGEYTCMAYNYMTKKNSTYSKMLTVVEPIKSVMIRNNTVPINSKNFTLTCDVTGPYGMIYWMKDNMNLNMTNFTSTPHMSYHIKNNMLHFTPLTMYSDGAYQCVATNHAGPHKSPQYMLLVNYGPLSVNISGPGSAKVNLKVSLNCSAGSRPDCNFQWFFNNNSMALNTGSVITFLANKGTEGSYMCKATNPVTNITMYQTKAFTLTAHASALHFLSQGGLMLMGLFALCVPVLFS
ncbi:carcinoembryonic antigen-related cell adhesion molecule 1 [Sander vitreus]